MNRKRKGIVQRNVITPNWSSELCNCRMANERRMHRLGGEP